MRSATTAEASAFRGLSLLLLCACAGGFTTPELDRSGPGGGGSGGVSAAGRGGALEGGAPDAEASGGVAGRSGAGGSEPAQPDPGAIDRPDAGSAVANGPPRVYCDAFNEVFKVTCGNGSCHSNRGATIGDFAAGPDSAAAYVSRGSVRDPDCGLIIDPLEPQNSLILTKITGDYPSEGNCGGPMPVGSFEVTDEQIDCVADWVEQFRQ